MTAVSVKAHTKRVKGKSVYVSGYTSSRKKTKAKESHADKIKRLTLAKVSDKSQANKLWTKYKDYPSNLDVMINGKWKNVTVEKWVSDDKGGRKKVKIEKRQLSLPEDGWAKLIKDNNGLIHRIINKFSWVSNDIQDDLKAVAIKSVFEAANNYEVKFNPSNPPDIQKHMASHIQGWVQAELSKQLATRFSVPYQKRVLYNKFTQLYDQFGGDYDAIYDAMKIRKKDLYPAIAEGGDEKLPRDGYVTAVKSDILSKKTESYEDKVNKLRDDYEGEVASLHARGEGITTEDKTAFDAAIKSIDKKIEGYEGKARTEKDKKAKIDYVEKISDLQKQKALLSREIKPIESEELGMELDRVKNDYKDKLRTAKQAFDKTIGKTLIQGAYPLFNEFEKIMSFRDVNISGSKMIDNEEVNVEQFERNSSAVNPEERMIIKETYIHSLGKMNQGLEALDPKVSKVLKMHLGLDETNEPYAHGLWGVPMEQVREIANNLPKDFYPRLDVDTKANKDNIRRWKSRKPSRVVSVKRTPSEQKKREAALKSWEKRKVKAKKEISKNIAKVKGVMQKSKYRELVHKKHKSSLKHKPTDIKTKKSRLSDAKLREATKKWKASKPTMEMKSDTIERRIRRDIDLGKIALRQIVPKSVYHDLMESYSDMRAYNIRKSHLVEDLKKSLTVDKFLGFQLVYIPEEDSIVKKAYKKIRSIYDTLFN